MGAESYINQRVSAQAVPQCQSFPKTFCAVSGPRGFDAYDGENKLRSKAHCVNTLRRNRLVKFMNRLRNKAQDTKDETVVTPKDIELLTKLNELMEEQNALLKSK